MTGTTDITIGIDIGGTHIRVASFTGDSPCIRQIERCDSTGEYSRAMPGMIGMVQNVAGSNRIKAVGIGLPGRIGADGGMLERAPNLSGWVGKPIRDDLRNALGVPVTLVNDTVVAALGEAWFGVADRQPFGYFIWGTGIGAAYVTWESGVPSVRYVSVGHTPVETPGIPCRCGKSGCLERYAGGNGIVDRYGRHADALTGSEWDEVVGYFARGLVWFLREYPVTGLIFAGGIAVSQPAMVSAIHDASVRIGNGTTIPPMQVSTFGADAGVVGAMTAATHRYRLSFIGRT